MGQWQYQLSIEDRRSGIPMFLQIARTISDDVQRARLRPGDRLPGTRTLALALGVNRNTVLAAYGELKAEGWVRTSRTRGTFVEKILPDPGPRGFGPSLRVMKEAPIVTGFPLESGPFLDSAPQQRSGPFVFRTSAPDVRLVPFAALARGYRRALQLHGASLLSYREPEGHPRLRAALARMLAATRGLTTSPESMFVTNGSQMALHLAGRALFRAGDRVAVEAIGYRQAGEAFRSVGAELVPIAVDEEGLDVGALIASHRENPIRAVYVTPHHQYPTTVGLSGRRRTALLEFASRNRIAIIEDDYDHEFHFDGHPSLPLASVDPSGVVIYVGTLSQILAPGVRLGYIAAPRQFVARLSAQRALVDVQGDHAIEYAVAELIEDGELQRHLRRAQHEYGQRRTALADALDRLLGHHVRFTMPTGGTGIWVEARGAVDVEEWSARATVEGTGFETARGFAFDGLPRPFFRLGFAGLNVAEIREGVRRLANAVPLHAGSGRMRQAVSELPERSRASR